MATGPAATTHAVFMAVMAAASARLDSRDFGAAPLRRAQDKPRLEEAEEVLGGVLCTLPRELGLPWAPPWPAANQK